MSMLIDHRQVSNWAKRLHAAPQKLDREMVKTTNAVAGRGVEYAVENAPHKDGNLVAAIEISKRASSGDWSAAYGAIGIEYAWQREEGGVIRARNKPYLMFQVNGQWVKVKSVKQKGSHYMKKAHRRIWPEATLAWGMAIERSLEGV